VSLITQRVGSTKLKVLSAVAAANRRGETPRQKDLVEATTLTKGAVSNNCSKLVDEDVLEEDDGRYTVDTQVVLSLYIMHLEEYCRREPNNDRLKSRIELYNRARSIAKNRIGGLDSQAEEVLQDVLLTVLAGARDEPHIQTFREALFRTDDVVQDIAEIYAGTNNEEQYAETILLLAAIMHRNNTVLASMDTLEDHDITQPFHDERFVEHLVMEEHHS